MATGSNGYGSGVLLETPQTGYIPYSNSLARSSSPNDYYSTILGEELTDLGIEGGAIPGAGQPVSNSLAKAGPAVDPGSTPFFSGGSIAGNIGQGLNLAGSGLSLYGMLQNMSNARKNHRLNRRNINQQMEQSATAFNRDVARQDRTIQGAKDRNERIAQLNQ